MTLFLNHDDVHASVTMHDAIEAIEEAFQEQGAGAVLQPNRLNVKAGKGWLRLGPAVMERSGWMGFKAMNLAAGFGVRYQVHLYRIADGDLVAIMDAQHLTTLRTGATSAVATRRLARKDPTMVGVLGSGVESRAQLEAMHALNLVRSARVYSPNSSHRERFAVEMSNSLDVEVVPVPAGRDAVAGCGIVVAGVKSTETVVFGDWLDPGTHVNSVGTARPEQREIDLRTFQRSAVVVVDTKQGVFGEAGDAIAAKDVIALEQVYELSDLVAGRAPVRTGRDQITLFKSVGMTLEDIALAARVYSGACQRGLGTKITEFPVIKPI